MSEPGRSPGARITATVESGDRIDKVVSVLVPELSRSRAAALVKQGAVRVDGEVCEKASTRVSGGAEVSVDVPPPVPDEAVPQDLPLSVVYEDSDLVVVDKAAGMVVHPGAGHPDGTLVNALLHHVGDLSGIGGVQRPGIVHRLDKGTSGLLVVAKHDRSHRGLAAQFADKSAGRIYLALCLAEPDAASGTIRSHLARHPTVRVRWASTDGSYGKRAVTHWRCLGRAHGMALVSCELETGRTHQIRVHLTEQGWPLAGDPLYKRGDRRPWSGVRAAVEALEDRVLLHAWSLSLTHPTTGERCTWTTPLPDDFSSILETLGLGDLAPSG